ncbi:MAG: peptidase inhibitor I78 [Proteobacteria bacterium]|nr:peptidase inhibitor I78 [Pseudomonadota bacterium]
MPAEQCRQQPGQAFVGQTASAETGQKMLAATHARQLRWVPPRSAVTMDFRYDRLTVGYDDSMIITSVNCN